MPACCNRGMDRRKKAQKSAKEFYTKIALALLWRDPRSGGGAREKYVREDNRNAPAPARTGTYEAHRPHALFTILTGIPFRSAYVIKLIN